MSVTQFPYSLHFSKIMSKRTYPRTFSTPHSAEGSFSSCSVAEEQKPSVTSEQPEVTFLSLVTAPCAFIHLGSLVLTLLFILLTLDFLLTLFWCPAHHRPEWRARAASGGHSEGLDRNTSKNKDGRENSRDLELPKPQGRPFSLCSASVPRDLACGSY